MVVKRAVPQGDGRMLLLGCGTKIIDVKSQDRRLDMVPLLARNEEHRRCLNRVVTGNPLFGENPASFVDRVADLNQLVHGSSGLKQVRESWEQVVLVKHRALPTPGPLVALKAPLSIGRIIKNVALCSGSRTRAGDGFATIVH